MARKKAPAETKVESIRHKDKRTNIPTEETRTNFIAEEDEQAPETMLYPRDPSLDPQLVWRGKDEQDRQDLAVPVVPIYIQEKIHPQAIIDDLMAQRKSKPGEQQLSLFNDFNGIDDFDKKISFATMVLDNLRKAGVQNTVKNERLKFDTLEPFAGTWLNATGNSTGADGKSHSRGRVHPVPEHG